MTIGLSEFVARNSVSHERCFFAEEPGGFVGVEQRVEQDDSHEALVQNEHLLVGHVRAEVLHGGEYLREIRAVVVVAEADVDGREGGDGLEKGTNFLVIGREAFHAGSIAIVDDGLGADVRNFGHDLLEIFPGFEPAIFVVFISGNVGVGNEREVEALIFSAFLRGVASGDAEGGRAQCSCCEKAPSIKRLKK
jgi:hypothetical protein